MCESQILEIEVKEKFSILIQTAIFLASDFKNFLIIQFSITVGSDAKKKSVSYLPECKNQFLPPQQTAVKQEKKNAMSP
jgi:hypothetical protein